MPHRRLFLAALVLLVIPFAPTALAQVAPTAPEDAATGAPPAAAAGSWRGAIQLPNAELAIQVILRAPGEDAAGWSGSVDIPQQGAQGIPLEKIGGSPPTLRFTLAGIAGEPTFEGTLDGDTISGTFRQASQSAPFTLERVTGMTDRMTTPPAAPPARPQEPKPPFPYTVREVTVESKGENPVTLAGTLTLPGDATAEAPAPAVLLLTGSGPQDRDQTIAGHKPFLLWADTLTRRGVAVLRLDDRGVGGSGGDFLSHTYADQVADVHAALRFLAAEPAVDSSRLGLLGHSEGGIIAPLAATAEGAPPVAFVVLLATPTVPGDALLLRQLKQLGRAQGVPPALEEVYDRLLEVGIPLVRDGHGDQLAERLNATVEAIVAAHPTGPLAAYEAVARSVAQTLTALDTPRIVEFLNYDPRPALRKLRVPVLAVWAENDLNVAPAQNRPALEAALGEGVDVTVKVFPGLNHLFQPSETGNPVEYGGSEVTVDDEVLGVVGGWVGKTVSTLTSLLISRKFCPSPSSPGVSGLNVSDLS